MAKADADKKKPTTGAKKSTKPKAGAKKPTARKATAKKAADGTAASKSATKKAATKKKPAAKKAPAKKATAAKVASDGKKTAKKPAAKKTAATRSAPTAEPKPAELKTDTVLEPAHPQDEVSFGKLIDWTIDRDTTVIKKYVDNMRARYPKLTKEQLARKITSRRALKSGMVGALTSAGGLPTLPFTVPINVVITWRIQVFTVMAVAHVYGHLNKTEDIRTDIYLILAGDAAKEALKRMGVQVSKDVTRYSVRSLLSKSTLTRANRLLGKRILGATGKKSLVRLVPIVGAAVGFVFDWSAAQAFGKYAIQYYSQK